MLIVNHLASTGTLLGLLTGNERNPKAVFGVWQKREEYKVAVGVFTEFVWLVQGESHTPRVNCSSKRDRKKRK